jgi:ethanolamine utilization protein EutA
MAREDDRRRGHTLADHRYGVDPDHVHGPGNDHDHDHDHEFVPDGVDAEALHAQNEIRLISVGIDIGSSGTQVIFSRLTLRRRASDASGRYAAVERVPLFQSEVAFTPYLGAERIDAEAVGEMIDRAYVDAGLHPDAVDAGAVILTGAALRRENADAIAQELAERGGEFVCAAAGHHMEAMLAAYGSGAASASHEQGLRILNVDIGGGTTKLALLDDGRVVEAAALAIGGRQLVVDDERRVTRLDPGAGALAEQAGVQCCEGELVSEQSLGRYADWLAERLIAILRGDLPASERDALYLTEPLAELERVERVHFSGGVAEFIYGREQRDFGDLGRLLGQRLRARIDAGGLPWPLLPAGECIRATALGASSYGMQLSGTTIYVSDPGVLLPRSNLQVLQPDFASGSAQIEPAELAAAIRKHFIAFDLVEGEADVVLALRWQGESSFERLSAFARGIVAALPSTLAQGRPLYVILDGDIAQTLGALLKEEMQLASPVLVIDGVTLWDFDYVDLGRIRLPSNTVPVTIKSLAFKHDPRLPHAHHRHGVFDIGWSAPSRRLDGEQPS